ncbi:response regulator [Massilia antarctica]|uniref:response regulator n=1 Tax=Massilia antarctica TaxID=2765360 RepID=UPI0006BB87F7|nr:response regulator [Massilia sp. H27-R4]MCY0910555.1 response regulator [Massilia sp. H27-R4]CUI09087.1 sensory box histidine kinase/response regulator [Janthinobacterium sp. CG23_2]CUU32873.1 sensory box histidine kinase/response regulator [Janthinobacterium sp. CG23_2]
MHDTGNAAAVASTDWSSTDLGDPRAWPPALRLCVDIVLNTPLPMLLLWGPRRIVVFNHAYADLAGPRHPRAPGGLVPSVWPAPLAASAAALERALGGNNVQLARQRLSFLRESGLESADFDLFFTPVRDGDAVGGVLCALSASAPLAAPALPAGGLRILVVEDNLDSQYLVVEMLRAFGHEADGVGDAESALALIARNSYHVLFSDVSLPGMSGVDMAREALRLQSGLNVIFASGYGDALLRHVEFAHQSLQKPYELEHLQAALASVSRRLHSGV